MTSKGLDCLGVSFPLQYEYPRSAPLCLFAYCSDYPVIPADEFNIRVRFPMFYIQFSVFKWPLSLSPGTCRTYSGSTVC